jgi:hypothetical protein
MEGESLSQQTYISALANGSEQIGYESDALEIAF